MDATSASWFNLVVQSHMVKPVCSLQNQNGGMCYIISFPTYRRSESESRNSLRLWLTYIYALSCLYLCSGSTYNEADSSAQVYAHDSTHTQGPTPHELKKGHHSPHVVFKNTPPALVDGTHMGFGNERLRCFDIFRHGRLLRGLANNVHLGIYGCPVLRNTVKLWPKNGVQSVINYAVDTSFANVIGQRN
jgi:hypothetical protein